MIFDRQRRTAVVESLECAVHITGKRDPAIHRLFLSTGTTAVEVERADLRHQATEVGSEIDLKLLIKFLVVSVDRFTSVNEVRSADQLRIG